MKAWHMGVVVFCFVVLAVGSVAGLLLYVEEKNDRELRDATLAVCARANVLADKLKLTQEVSTNNWRKAAETRSESARQSDDIEVAILNSETAQYYLDQVARLTPVEEIDCLKVIP